MAALIQSVARQAQQTFSKSLPDDRFPECLAILRQLVHQLRPPDLNFDTSCLQPARRNWLSLSRSSAPVAYLDLCETNAFTMGIFVIRPGCKIPLHDHPGMYGVMKVLHGKLRIRSFTSIKTTHDTSQNQHSSHNSVIMHEEITECGPEDDPSLLSPFQGNIHEVSASGGAGAAFLDILAPPYKLALGRDCSYYQIRPYSRERDETLFCVSEIPAPQEFWCEQLTYTGPKIELK